MKPFNFLSPKNSFNGYTFDNDIIDEIYNMCEIYVEFIERCKRDFLRENPQVDPMSDYSYPIPHNPIERDFIEGKLWHGGSDYDEDENVIKHFLFLDHIYQAESGEYEYFTFYVQEFDNGSFKIIEVDKGNNELDLE